MNSTFLSKAQEIVQAGIDRIDGPKKPMKSSVHVLCPFHQENTPSCSINCGSDDNFVPIGWFYCFGCGRTGPWNDLAAQIGLPKIGKQDSIQENSRNLDLKKLENELLTETKLDIEKVTKILGAKMAIDFNLPVWRKIKGELLRKIGAKLIVQDRDLEMMILLPVYVKGNLVGAIKGRLKKSKIKGQTNYFNMFGEWAKTQGLFPFDYAIRLAKKKGIRWLVLVEGPRDALRLLMNGIPAVSILGIEQWCDAKRDLVLSTGLNILLCMDGDDPGVKGSNIIYRDIKNYTKVKVMKLKKVAKKLDRKVDPGNMPKKYIQQVKDIIGA